MPRVIVFTGQEATVGCDMIFLGKKVLVYIFPFRRSEVSKYHLYQARIYSGVLPLQKFLADIPASLLVHDAKRQNPRWTTTERILS